MRINIRITDRNAPKIEAALTEAQGTAVRTNVADINSVRAAVEAAEAHLKTLGIPKRAWNGCTLTFATAGAPDRTKSHGYSYSQSTPATWLQIERVGTGWVLVGAERSQVYSGQDSEELRLGTEAVLHRAEALAAAARKRVAALEAELADARRSLDYHELTLLDGRADDYAQTALTTIGNAS